MSDVEVPAVEYRVAKQNLSVDGVNAFTKGDLVPLTTVQSRGWDDVVEKAFTAKGEPTKAAEKLRDEAVEAAARLA